MVSPKGSFSIFFLKAVFWKLVVLAILGVCWLVNASLQSLPPSSHLPLGLCMLELLSFYKDTSHWIKALFHPPLNVITFLFPSKVIFTSSNRHDFSGGGDTAQLSRGSLEDILHILNPFE